MGSGPKFAKLRKAIAHGTVEEVVQAMFNLRFRADRATSHGENIRKETHRALRHLKYLHQGSTPAKVVKALEVAQARAGDAWNKNPAETTPPAPKVEVPNVEVKPEGERIPT